MTELTFRDFAGAVMGNDLARAAVVLRTLLALDETSANAAVSHFHGRMTEPEFMSQAMGLRAAVTSGSDEEISALLGDCFGLTDEALHRAVTALRTRHPATT